MRRTAMVLALVFVAPLTALAPASAQELTDEQKQKIRLDCRSDYIKYCSDITPGGIDALNCLQAHLSSLSSACQTDVNAIEIEMK